MSILDAILFRARRYLGLHRVGRADVVERRALSRWIRLHGDCVMEEDLQVRGRSNALEFVRIGSGCSIDKGCIVWIAGEPDATPQLTLGNRVYIGPYSFLGSYATLEIGDSTIVGANAYIITASHRALPDLPVQDQGYDAAPVRIGCDVWIGCHVVILPGVTIGDHAVIGAGAVVNRDVPSGEKWAGVPARPIGTRTV